MIGLFYGSDTGVTEEITHYIKAHFDEIEVHEICDVKADAFNDYDKIIIGLSTWYDGDLQSDWEDFYEKEFKTIDFTDKKVALFGLGDQIGYAEYFIDGVGILAKKIIENKGEIIGIWPTKDYRFTESKAVIPDQENYFYGLALDHDNQSELTEDKIEEWVADIKIDFKE